MTPIYSGSIHLGDNVALVVPVLISARRTIRIDDYVMFGHEVTVRANHRADVVGQPMIAWRKQDGDETFRLR